MKKVELPPTEPLPIKFYFHLYQGFHGIDEDLETSDDLIWIVTECRDPNPFISNESDVPSHNSIFSPKQCARMNYLREKCKLKLNADLEAVKIPVIDECFVNLPMEEIKKILCNAGWENKYIPIGP